MKSSFFIIADRGNLKAFRAEAAPADRPAHLHLVHSFQFTEGHAKMKEINEDAAGGFPAGGGGGSTHANSVADKHLDLEIDRRVVKQLAQHITELLHKEKPKAWSFAAPGELKNSVLEHLGGAEKNTLAESIASNLVKVEVSELLSHFDK